MADQKVNLYIEGKEVRMLGVRDNGIFAGYAGFAGNEQYIAETIADSLNGKKVVLYSEVPLDQIGNDRFSQVDLGSLTQVAGFLKTQGIDAFVISSGERRKQKSPEAAVLHLSG